MNKTTYSDQLKDPRWQKKRLEILQRDGFTCQNCKSETKTLHIHHYAYMRGKKPWEYHNNLFETLCCDCHENIPDIAENIGDRLIDNMARKGLRGRDIANIGRHLEEGEDCETLDAQNSSDICRTIYNIIMTADLDVVLQEMLNEFLVKKTGKGLDGMEEFD